MTVRLGLIGAGAIGVKHADAAASLQEVSLQAVCDIDSARSESLAAGRSARSFTDWRRMIEEASLDAVIVALPHALHRDVTVAAAEAGLHVLVEKPMATSVEACDMMIAACERAGVVLGVCHALRHHRQFRVASEIVEAGELGAPVTVSVRRSTDYDRPTRPGWFLDPEVAGGGIMFNLGSHAIDLIQWFGGAPVKRVLGRTATSDSSLSVETEGMALLQLTNGLHASVVVLGTGMPNTNDLDIVCADGVLRRTEGEGLWRFQARAGEQLAAPGEHDVDEAYRGLLADFADAIRLGRRPECDGIAGRSVVAAALAVYRSDTSGGWVDLVARGDGPPRASASARVEGLHR